MQLRAILISCSLLVTTFLGAIPSALAQEAAGQVIGSYNRGALQGASELSLSGAGFIKLFTSRNRVWGSDGLVSLVMEAAAQMIAIYPEGERLQVGDLSAINGGRITRHGSHQNGLDVDLVYLRMNRREQNVTDGDEGFVESFIREDLSVSPNLDLERNWVFFQLLVQSERISRIFVHPAIKKTLCVYTQQFDKSPLNEEVLRRLRPDVGHADHFHVRMTCPENSPRCEKQKEVAPGTGCDALLAD